MVAMDSNQEVQKTFESDFKSLSHKEALTVSRNLLEELLKDPLLQDIPKDTTASELQAKLDLEKGRAFIVNLRRSSEEGFEHIPIIVKQKTTVAELRLNIQRTLGRKIQEENGLTCLSWQHFWKTYWLVHNNEKLSDDRKSLKDYGIKDKSEITFLKRLRRT
ncbi:U11/U12 small nuclear ribonucleoprotein 25 kDa protein-like isoform X2 [Hydractinia symbiolongicarpus]|uniref:U11/U12 small nuclear ribonucleoprotein 25 kDa protein-like isoform X2 n=1 Tax=Hydractinia symbiolongicarpus TaxID=13093 RepID=UPI00254CAADA|nr:U11/U12 small nuclear ribonucleoprotein 25 kDa protein-like isoform X2 [Hydractinia symbiolongicarpus]